MPSTVTIICPECGSNRVRRSRSGIVTELLLMCFRVKAYRCRDCDWRGIISKGSSVFQPRRRNREAISSRYVVSAIAIGVLIGIVLIYYVTRNPEPIGRAG